ncbi:SusC/RagA family TonB-linked outer membrane protein [Carboxylicivirga marina]|uniref:SusC/RagA family TonB-linked outer membrane protein n=1 Tax=Carboxylicivirga marina TaxID=2800988 RepID=A0ABS1HMR7_9BACT|nr:SusC/RagA family TonB-linked outer membrane protein [Carboxylicivirga marina]MBK3518891.1 SusC/RagA family TonB-linked outer membrane protein [Carboxylicivirga marina]
MIKKYINRVLFVSLASLLMLVQTFAQESDSTAVNLGYDIRVAADESAVAVGIASAKDLSKYFAINPSNALYGQIPGLTVLQNGGDFWSSESASMFVRGQANLDNTSAPLVLIDGFERKLSTITVEEIESVTVLKDAGATAIYGQRGANGVIVITTKRGKNEGMKVDISYEYSTNEPFRMPTMMDAYGYASAMNEALELDGQAHLYSKEQLDAYKNGMYPEYYPNVNWTDEVMRNTGFVHNFNTTFRGGTNKTKYYVAINYMDGEGLLKQDRNRENYSTQLNYRRANLRSNLDIQLTGTTQMKFNLAGRISGINQPGKANSENIMSLITGTPANAFPVQYADGSWGGSGIYKENPVADINQTGYGTGHERTLYADLTLIQDLSAITEGLSLSAAVSFDNNVIYWDQKTKNYAYVHRTADIDEITGQLYNFTSNSYGENTPLAYGTAFGGQNRRNDVIIKANYDQVWGKHKLNALALFHADNEVGYGKDLTFNRINYAGQFNYSFDKKYLAGLSLSYSGNNILSENNRFHFYPALSLGWMLSNENFLKDVSAINSLKLRTSVGLSGLEPGVPYLHLPSYGDGQNYYFTDNNDGNSGLQENRRANPDIKPEKSLMTNIGLDANLFGKLSLNIDAFYEERSQILVSEASSTSKVIGVPATLVSDGIVENKGFELGALWQDNIGDFSYSIGAQYSLAKNKIIEQNEVFREWDHLKRTGHSVDQQFGLLDDGFWGVNDGLNGVDNISPDGIEYTYTSVLKPGDVKYVDKNGDNKIDEFDMVAIGKSWLPEVYYSFTLGAEYKGIGFNAILQGASNVTTMLNTPGVYWPLYNNNNISTFSNDRWTPETATTATLPRLSPEENMNNYRASTVWQRDASFLKLRTIELYYHLPESIVNKVKLKRAKVFFRGMNLLSFDDFEMMDPEQTKLVYPTLKSYNIGLSVGF